MNKIYLTTLLEKYCPVDNPEKTGLLLLDLPTGFGKTYAVQKYIADNYEKSNRKIIYITDLKKNIDFDGMKEKFFKHKKKQFERDFIFIDSNVNCVINNLTINRESISKNITEHPNFIKLIYEIKNYEKITDKEWKDKVKKEIRIIEPKFRELIWKDLKEKFKTKEQRFYAIKEWKL